jgi:hypothetical protein
MTREEFIKRLDVVNKWAGVKGEPIYTIDEKGKILITGNNGTVAFNKTKGLDIPFVDSIPEDVEFNNDGAIRLDNVKHIDPSVRFNNTGWIYLGELFNGMTTKRWEGNIEGIDNKGLLNLMISKGLFV